MPLALNKLDPLHKKCNWLPQKSNAIDCEQRYENLPLSILLRACFQVLPHCPTEVPEQLV